LKVSGGQIFQIPTPLVAPLQVTLKWGQIIQGLLSKVWDVETKKRADSIPTERCVLCGSLLALGEDQALVKGEQKKKGLGRNIFT